MPPKRKGAAKSGDKGKGKAKQPKQDGQKAVSHDIEIPIDEGFKEDGMSKASSVENVGITSASADYARGRKGLYRR